MCRLRFLMVVCSLLVGVLLAVVQCGAQNPFLSSQPDYPNWSPFTAVRWESEQPHVQVAGEWYRLVSIHGVTVDEIKAKCNKEGWPFRMRFEEDLVQLLRLMGHNVGKTTSLKLIDQQGKEVTRSGVKMTEDNLRQTQLARYIAANPFYSGAVGYPDWSPFGAVRWIDDKPLVSINGQWYTPISIHGIKVETMLDHSKQQGWDTKERFTEDTVQMIRLMGGEIDKKTDLVLRDSSGGVVTLPDFEMKFDPPRYVPMLSAKDVTEDLALFKQSLQDRFAYADANGFDYSKRIEAIGTASVDEMPADELASQLELVMMGFIDGHARVSGTRRRPGKILPFRLENTGKKVVAVLPDRSSFVHDDYPFVIEIDGAPVEEWVKRTSPWIAKGSPQLLRHRGLGKLGVIDRYRDKDVGQPIDMTFESKDGKSKLEATVELTTRWERSNADWPAFPDNGVIDSEIGYLRLAKMDGRSVEAIREWMPRFRQTQGLIVDVRSNGGGARTPILELAGYLMDADDPPRIGNVAKYRLADDRGKNHLSAARFVYRVDSPKFGERERAAVKEFAAGFKPEWEPRAEDFSEWHYLVLSKSKEDPRYHYKKPVVILMDTDCFSATDIFLSTFKGWPNVTLMGRPSSGGSARTELFRLPNSGISVACASMASFQPSGELYDGNGVLPDIVLEQPAEHFLIGGPDADLDAAKQRILRAVRSN